jgi:hypothetical protein
MITFYLLQTVCRFAIKLLTNKKGKTMKKLILAAAALIFSSSVFAGNVQIRWVDVEKYSDLKPTSNERADALQSKFFDFMQRTVEEYAKNNIAKDYTLVIAVYDVDLAGKVKPSNNYGVQSMSRIIDDSTPPRLSVGYILVDKDNKEIKSGAALIESKKFRARGSNASTFHYEKKAIKRWLDSEFK